MAPCRSRIFSLLLLVCMATLLPSFSVADTQSDFFNSINVYRTSKGLPTVSQDAGDQCLAQTYVSTYVFPPCSIITGPYPVELPSPTNFTGCPISPIGCSYDACAVCTPGGIIALPQLLAFYTSGANASSTCGGALTNGLITKVGMASSSSWLVVVVQPNCTSPPPSGGSNPGLGSGLGSGPGSSSPVGSGPPNGAQAKEASLVIAGLALGAYLIMSWPW